MNHRFWLSESLKRKVWLSNCAHSEPKAPDRTEHQHAGVLQTILDFRQDAIAWPNHSTIKEYVYTVQFQPVGDIADGFLFFAGMTKKNVPAESQIGSGLSAHDLARKKHKDALEESGVRRSV